MGTWCLFCKANLTQTKAAEHGSWFSEEAHNFYTWTKLCKLVEVFGNKIFLTNVSQVPKIVFWQGVLGNEFWQIILKRVYLLKVKSPGWDKLP